MSESSRQPSSEPQSQPAPNPYGGPPPGSPPPGSPEFTGELGKVRSTGMCILLAIVTLGIYVAYWYFVTHEEMKKHSGDGLGGLVALLLALFVGFVMPYLTANEVGNLYARRGQERPVSALTGLWYFPGMLILVGPVVWFVKTNNRLNEYWISQGAPA